VRPATVDEGAGVKVTEVEVALLVEPEYKGMLVDGSNFPRFDTYLVTVTSAETSVDDLIPGSVCWLAHFPELGVVAEGPRREDGQVAAGTTITRGYVLLDTRVAKVLLASWTNQE
jgi:hypothetical protein